LFGRLVRLFHQAAALGDESGHGLSGFTRLAKSGNHAETIRLRSVLAHLPFAFDPEDRNLDAVAGTC
jgi:hypothetical protein